MPRKCGKDGCPRRPLYGIPGKKGVYCGEHKTGDQMIDVVSRRCSHPGCGKRPLYGHAGGPPITCAAHKQPGMEDRKSRRCNGPDCDTVPSYGYPGERATRCAAHRDAGMHNVVSSPCESLGCSARAAFANTLGERARFCEAHKAPRMVDVRARRCCHRGCARQSAFANPGERASACAVHKLDGMIEVKAAVREAEAAAAAAAQAAGIPTISPRRKEFAVPRLEAKAAFAEAALVVFQEALVAKHRVDNYRNSTGTGVDINVNGYSGASGGEEGLPSPASPAFVPLSGRKGRTLGRRRRVDGDGSEPPIPMVPHIPMMAHQRGDGGYGQGGSSGYDNGDNIGYSNGYGGVTGVQPTSPAPKRRRRQPLLAELPLPPRQNNITLTPPPSYGAGGGYPATTDDYATSYGQGYNVWSAGAGDMSTGVGPGSPWLFEAGAAEALLGPPPPPEQDYQKQQLPQQLPPSPLPPPPPPLPLPVRGYPRAYPAQVFPHSAGARAAGPAASFAAYNNLASPLLRQHRGNTGGSHLFSVGSSNGNASTGYPQAEQVVHAPRAVERQRLPGVSGGGGSGGGGSGRPNGSGMHQQQQQQQQQRQQQQQQQPSVPPLPLLATSMASPIAVRTDHLCLSTGAAMAMAPEDDPHTGGDGSTGGFWTASPDDDDDSPLMALSPGSGIWTPSPGGGRDGGGDGGSPAGVDLAANGGDAGGGGGGSGGSDSEGGLSPIPVVLPRQLLPLSLSPPPPLLPPVCLIKQEQQLFSEGVADGHLPHRRGKQEQEPAATAAAATSVVGAGAQAQAQVIAATFAECGNDVISLRPMLGASAARMKGLQASPAGGDAAAAPEKASAAQEKAFTAPAAAAAAANGLQRRRSPAPWEGTTELLSPQGWLGSVSGEGLMMNGSGAGDSFLVSPGGGIKFLEDSSVPV